MKKIILKLPKTNILKETQQERKMRVNTAGSSMVTKIVPNKRKLTTKQQRQENKQLSKRYED